MTLLRLASLLLVALATRLPGRAKWLFVALFSLAGIVCASLVSHAAAQPAGRAFRNCCTSPPAQSGWACSYTCWRRAKKILTATAPASLRLLAGIIRRFSPVALTVSTLLLISGAYGVCRYLAAPAPC